MLKPYATEARSQFTLIYRGYDLEVTRAPSGWFVGVYPRSADLPILRQSDFYALLTKTRQSSKPETEWIGRCFHKRASFFHRSWKEVWFARMEKPRTGETEASPGSTGEPGDGREAPSPISR